MTEQKRPSELARTPAKKTTPKKQPGPEPTPRVKRAGGHVDLGDGRGWVLDPDEPEPAATPEPVDPGTAGLPGHPAMAAAGWTLAKEA